MIRSLIIQINSKCNINCSYCYSKNKFNYNKNRLDYSICKILKKFDIKDATITGGEPLLDYKFLLKKKKKINTEGC
jgi:molybdenum cofactor biosynthesis enzyme MoaA